MGFAVERVAGEDGNVIIGMLMAGELTSSQAEKEEEFQICSAFSAGQYLGCRRRARFDSKLLKDVL